MVFFNYATMQMAAKIVYYGPGLCGKTTNLHLIYSRTAPSSRGEMVSLETESDRTLFFDLLPIDVGVIGGFKTRLQLYTVPGQVFYNSTRKLVLKGVDGIVFVADSQIPMLEPNKESLRNLVENLAEMDLTVSDIPIVFQYNKRDLSNILTPDELHDALNPDRTISWFEASAKNGTGVFETLKGISKLTLRSLRGRMSEELRGPSVFAVAASRAASAAPSAPADQSAPFPAAEEAEIRHAEFPPKAKDEADEVSFAQASAKEIVAEDDTAVKHVRVRSNVDILSELEKLRKLATQDPSTRSGSFPSLSSSPHHLRAGRTSRDSLAEILGPAPGCDKDVIRSFDLSIPRAALGNGRPLTVILRFGSTEQGAGGPAERAVTVDLATAKDLQKLSLSLKFNIQAE